MLELTALIIPALAGLGVAISSGSLGVFVISQRLSFFSDALAHAALLGISVSLLLSLPINASFVFTALLFAIIFSKLLSAVGLSSDTLIGILAHSFLAISLLAISLFSDQSIDLEHYLFGDLLHVSGQHLFWISLCLLLSTVFLSVHWQDMILFTVHEELALVEGVNTKRLRLQLTLLLAFLVAISIQLIGALLISALLIIPASAARQWSQSPRQMVFGSSLVACGAVLIGLALCALFDTPSGPTIVAVATFIFSCSILLKKWR